MVLGLAGSFYCATPATADIATEWRDLQARCGAAVARGAGLDLAGLRERGPHFVYDREVESLGRRYIAPGVATVGGRIVPRSFEHPDGALRLRLIEHRTRPGTRAICEVIPRRDLSRAEAGILLDAYRDMQAAALAQGGWTTKPTRTDATVAREAMTTDAPNARGCPVVSSITVRAAEGSFRSAVSEMAGAPGCGGPSLLDRPAPPSVEEDT